MLFAPVFMNTIAKMFLNVKLLNGQDKITLELIA